MINNEINNFINTYLYDDYKNMLKEDEDKKIASFKCDRENELRTLRIHLENAKKTGLQILGINEVIAALETFKGKEINLINIRNKRHFFKIYSDVALKQYLGCIILKLRKKTPEEIRWGRDVLGIKNPPPDIE